MPLDGTTISLNPTYTNTWIPAQPKSLKQKARELGLNPISKLELEEHKKKQLEAHPPSWVYRCRYIMPSIFALSALSGISMFAVGIITAVTNGPEYLLISTGGLVTTFCGIYGLGTAKARGPARWDEYYNRLDETIPPEIRQVAERLSAETNVRFIRGELRQDRILLDPYLIARDRHGSEVILGIWDGDKIISCA